jgi:hypothetical protein
METVVLGRTANCQVTGILVDFAWHQSVKSRYGTLCFPIPLECDQGPVAQGRLAAASFCNE